ncbi:type III secretion system LEE outer membrane ring protein EscC [Escherichia coli]|uniref:type III secretion system LEE outer membrane ring protein EscC n=1 Tax=Escherichia coli TaxID=562 RepID=UPI000BE5499E|nr:type III secretion system LEE outer membrane ring protein EscC [Escherichia coli]
MKKISFFIFTALFCCSAQAAPSSLEKRLGKNEYFIITKSSPVRAILNDFAANYSIPVFISNSVNDDFSGEIKNEKPMKVLEKLSRLYHLTWYYDENILYIYKTNEISRSIITPTYLDIDSLLKYLRDTISVNKNSCNVRKITTFNSIEVRGVPECIKYITSLSESLDKEAQSKAKNKDVVRVFKLNYASATDITYKYRDQNVVVPGVVSILKTMASNGSLPSTGKGAVERNGNLFDNSVKISADPRLNAVVVKDREITMDIYRQLISELDIEQRQIEISVSIIDVDANDLQQLGVNWSGTLNAGQGSIAFNSSTAQANLSSSVISNANNFMIRVNALQQNSKAKILSQPSIITLNNMQAILDKNVTFYTKVSGEKVASLESITSGTLLRVTPRILDDNSNSLTGKRRERVRLLLEIQDGNQSTNQSNAQDASSILPEVQNSEMTTEATLSAGESLLLGGFIQDKESSSKDGIPLLSDIPVIGNLFSSTTKQKHSVVRLFLIKATPIKSASSE